MGLIQKIKSKSLNDVVHHFKNKKAHKKALQRRGKIISDYYKNNAFVKLQIGCGPFPISGWLNTDLLHSENVAFLDAGKRFPLEDNSVDVIFCEHLFEHLNFDQAYTMLKESFRVLKPGGRLRIATPDLEFLFKLKKSEGKLHQDYIANSINNHWNLKPVKAAFTPEEYHEVFVINNFFRDWGHQIVHNFSSIELMLKKSGFNQVIREEVGKSQVKELQQIEQHDRQIGPEFNLFETLVVEAIKS